MHEHDFYPQKPELIEVKSKGNFALTILSIVIFVMTFLFVFTDEVNFVFHLLIVLLIHELGHFICMKIFGYQNVRMLFIPLMGAFVQGSKEEYSLRQSLIVTAAGPLPGVLFGLTLIFLAADFQQVWMIDLGLLFLLLNMINLVPLDPLDGGQLFKLLMPKNQEMFLLVFAFISSMFLIAIGWFIDSYMLMAFGFIMGFRVRSFQKQAHLRKEFAEEDITYQTTYKNLSNRDFSKIKTILLRDSSTLRTYLESVPEEEAEPLLAGQVNGVLQHPIKRDASLLLKGVTIFLWITALLGPLLALLFFKEMIREHYSWYLEWLSNR
jgi:Zn-dependent protease